MYGYCCRIRGYGIRNLVFESATTIVPIRDIYQPHCTLSQCECLDGRERRGEAGDVTSKIYQITRQPSQNQLKRLEMIPMYRDTASGE
jgi:hypothetical protein